MIVVRNEDGRSLAGRLAAKARRLAEARAESRLRRDRGWRAARLLWPLFGER